MEDTKYIAIDLEMSGLDTSFQTKGCVYENFLNQQKNANKYSIIQFGITLFTEIAGNIKAYIFNFYLYPQLFWNFMENEVNIHTDAMDYLKFHNSIDFNKWIKFGIPYYP